MRSVSIRSQPKPQARVKSKCRRPSHYPGCRRSGPMLELLFCSLLTIFPDYLYRRFAQGKRIGKEITLFSVWFELRWGIIACLMLTVALITIIFYFHPSTTNVTYLFRTVPISPETVGRVAEVYVQISDRVEQ